MAGLGAALDDAGNRLTASLNDRVGAAILRIHLGELAVRLEAGDQAGTRRALASARQALHHAQAADERQPGAGSELRQVLDDVEALLGGR